MIYRNVRGLILIFKNIRTKIHRTVILPVVLYGCETWSLRSRREHRLSVERKISGPKADEVTESGEDYIKKSLLSCTLYQILFGG